MPFSTTLKNFGKQPSFDMQPDYRFSDNGYGLVQLTANFVYDNQYAGQSSKTFARGKSLPDGTPLLNALTKHGWTCVRSEEIGKEANLVTVSAHYAAVSKDKGGVVTETEATLTSAVVSEPIESHPNFTRIQVESIGDGNPLGGTWKNGKPPDPDQMDGGKNLNKYRALWQKSVNQQANAIGWTFLGFAPSDNSTGSTVNRKAGVRSWMRPSVTMRLTGYTTDQSLAAKAAKRTWYVIKDSVGFLKIPDAYAGIAVDELGVVNLDVSGKKPSGRNWLVTSANMEVYGGLYKVTADILLSGVVGWDADIYPYDYAA